MRTIFTYLLLVACYCGFSQNSPPQVINSSGGSSFNGTHYHAYNVGEPVAITGTNNNPQKTWYTQGFLQPDYKIGKAFQASIFSVNESCLNAANGMILVNVYNGIGPVQFLWSTGDTAHQLSGLSPGTYSVQITDSANNQLHQVIVISASNAPCPVNPYTGLSPNGDGINDVFYIDGISEFPDNTVYIFNRWGQRIWKGEKYDNKTVVWDGRSDKGEKLVSGTYFYVIDLKDKKPMKGWVEILNK